jgi:hypothetical protein
MVKEWGKFRNTKTGELYTVKRVRDNMVVLQSEYGGKITISENNL